MELPPPEQVRQRGVSEDVVGERYNGGLDSDGGLCECW